MLIKKTLSAVMVAAVALALSACEINVKVGVHDDTSATFGIQAIVPKAEYVESMNTGVTEDGVYDEINTQMTASAGDKLPTNVKMDVKDDGDNVIVTMQAEVVYGLDGKVTSGAEGDTGKGLPGFELFRGETGKQTMVKINMKTLLATLLGETDISSLLSTGSVRVAFPGDVAKDKVTGTPTVEANVVTWGEEDVANSIKYGMELKAQGALSGGSSSGGMGNTIILGVVLLVIFGGGYLAYSQYKKDPKSNKPKKSNKNDGDYDQPRPQQESNYNQPQARHQQNSGQSQPQDGQAIFDEGYKSGYKDGHGLGYQEGYDFAVNESEQRQRQASVRQPVREDPRREQYGQVDDGYGHMQQRQPQSAQQPAPTPQQVAPRQPLQRPGLPTRPSGLPPRPGS